MPSVCLTARVDPVTTSRRLGHSRPSTTMDLHGHLFGNPDAAAVAAIRFIVTVATLLEQRHSASCLLRTHRVRVTIAGVSLRGSWLSKG
jgi:hypothetical protein